MGFSQKGQWPTGIESKLRIGLTQAIHLVGNLLVRKVQYEIRSGSKSGAVNDTGFFTIGSGTGRRIVPVAGRGNGGQRSAAGEYSANQSGALASSINFKAAGNGLEFYATANHAAFQEEGVHTPTASGGGTFPGRKNLYRAILESDGEIKRIIDMVVRRALGG